MPRSLTHLLIGLIAMAVTPGALLAQRILPSATGIDVDRTSIQTHVWIGIPARDDAGVLIHVTPSNATPTANVASRLSVLPEAIAADGRKVFLCFPPIRGEDGVSRRRVLTLSTESYAGGSRWRYTGTPRLQPLASITMEAELFGFASAPSGLHALLLAPTGPTLLRLDDQAWAPIPLPSDLTRRDQSWSLTLLSAGDRLVLVDASDPAAPHIWFRHDDPERDDALEWTRADAALEQASRGFQRASAVALPGERLAWLDPTGDEDLQLVTAIPLGRFELGPVQPAGGDVALFAAGTGSDVMLLARTADEKGLGELSISRISTATGTVLTESPLRTAGPVSAAQFVLVIVMLASVLMLIVTFVFWPEHPREPTLPSHLRAASASARLIASAVDLVLAAIPAAMLLGVPISDALLPWFSEDPLSSFGATALALAFAAAHATIGEWAFGRSLGKAMLGLEVLIESAGELRKPLLWEAVVRNALKWGLAPVSLAGLASSGRHLGDLVCHGVVVTQAIQDEAPDA